MGKTLYVNGDSWSEGFELSPTDDLPLKNNFTQEIKEYRYFNGWPYKLFKKIGYEAFLNKSIGLSSNSRMFRTTTDFILEYEKENNLSDLIIIISLTTFCQDEYGIIYDREFYFPISYVKNHRILREDTDLFNKDTTFGEWGYDKNSLINKDDFDFYEEYYRKKMLPLREYFNKCLRKLYSFLCFLENKKIKYLVFQGHQHVDDILTNKILDSNFDNQNQKKLYNKIRKFNGFISPTEMSFNKFMIDNSYNFGKYHHPLQEGHDNWCDFIHHELKVRGYVDP